MENELKFINRSKIPLVFAASYYFSPSLEISECSMSQFPKLKVNEVECVFPITISLSYGDPEKHGFPFS